MKNKLLVTFIALFMSMNLIARNAIKVVNGDLSVFNNASITASVKFDYTDLNIEGKPYMEHLKSRGSDFVRDWPKESKSSESYFIKCWNHDNEQGMQLTSAAGKEYIMVFVVKEMHMGSGAASMLVGFGAGGATMSGTMYILKGNHNVPLLTVSIDEQSGRSGMTEIARRVDLYGELAEDMVKTLQKTKQSKVPASTEAVTIPSMELTGMTQKSDITETKSTSKTTDKRVKVKEDENVKKSVSAVFDNARIQMLMQAKGKEIVRKKKPYLGDFEAIAAEKEIGVFLDFSNALIMDQSEEDFINYMKTSAGRKDVDPNFSETWVNEIKPALIDIFCGEVNEELRDEDCNLRFKDGIDYNYVLKLEVMDLDDDGNNVINYLFVNTQTGEVDAQIKCESDGGRVGRYVGLLEQGFESAGEDFVEILIERFDL